MKFPEAVAKFTEMTDGINGLNHRSIQYAVDWHSHDSNNDVRCRLYVNIKGEGFGAEAETWALAVEKLRQYLSASVELDLSEAPE